MNLSNKDAIKALVDELNTITGDLIQNQADVAAKIIKNQEEGSCNIALLHLAIVMKISLRLLCMKNDIVFLNSDSIEVLFDKTYNFLPVEILDMAKDICYWLDYLPYETKQAKTTDEGLEIGKQIQHFYNENVVPAVVELLKKLEAEASTAIAANTFSKF